MPEAAAREASEAKRRQEEQEAKERATAERKQREDEGRAKAAKWEAKRKAAEEELDRVAQERANAQAEIRRLLLAGEAQDGPAIRLLRLQVPLGIIWPATLQEVQRVEEETQRLRQEQQESRY